jgi:hypothetical protein
MRLLGLTSGESGRDWDTLTKKIDLMLEAQGFDLAEETIVIEFDGEKATVYRPVIGGLRELPAPWILTDRTSREVNIRTLNGEFWDDIFGEIGEEKFTILLKRRLGKELTLKAETYSFF